MAAARLPFRLAPMTIADLGRVLEIEAVAHSAPWPASAYEHELLQNEVAHYLVLLPEGPTSAPARGWWARLGRWFGRRAPEPRPLLGYGGFWLIVDEAHISTIAVDEVWRGKGLGELLLLGLIEEALLRHAVLVTLEVRVSNEVAQGLYRKYGFAYVGHRKRYYRNNNEDAHIMTVENVQSGEYRAFLDERWLRLRERFAHPNAAPIGSE